MAKRRVRIRRRKKTEKQLERELLKPRFKEVDVEGLRFIATSPNKRDATAAKKELRKRRVRIIRRRRKK